MEGVAPPFAAVMFDLDGVLRNTEPYHRMAYAQLARSLSGGAPPDAGEIAGKSNLQLYEALVARFGGPATAEELSQRHFRLVCQLLEEYRDIYFEDNSEPAQICQLTFDFNNEAEEQGIR